MISIIFVEPEGSGNIGSLARVMKNFGFDKLVLVKPPELDNNETRMMAMHAYDLIEKARIFPTFKDAIKDFDHVIGTTACLCRHKNIAPLKSFLKKPIPDNAAIVFGRESTGLTNEEKELCEQLITIPANKKYSTLNVTHAAAIVLYELFQKNK